MARSKMLPLLPKQVGKTQQGDSLCTKAVSEELMLSETTPVTLRDQYAIFFLDFKEALDGGTG